MRLWTFVIPVGRDYTAREMNEFDNFIEDSRMEI